jgi:hypothetical protein
MDLGYIYIALKKIFNDLVPDMLFHIILKSKLPIDATITVYCTSNKCCSKS